MDNPNQPRSNPLGYDAMKAVIKSMSVEKRQELHSHIPQLRTINSTVPYKLEKVSIQHRFIQINNKRWNFKKTRNNEGYEYMEANDIVNLDMELVSKPNSIRPNKQFHFQLNKPYEKLYNSVVHAYLKNGVVIGELYIGIQLPDFLHKRNAEDWKMKVSKISFYQAFHYETIVPYLDLSQLECANFTIAISTLRMFEKPEIINCKKLILNTCGLPRSVYDPIKNFLLELKSPHEIISPPDFLIEDFLKKWIECPRPIGTRLTMPFYNPDIDTTFDVIKENLGAVSVEHPRKEEATRCVSLKMSDGNILIFHHVDDPSRFEIEVFEGVKPTDNVKDGEPSEKKMRQ